MCNFLSAIIRKNGDVLCDPEHTDSHEDLILMYGLRDGELEFHHQEWVRVEFLPPSDSSKTSDLSNWKLVLDENNKPDWYDEVVVREKLERRVSQTFVIDHRKILVGGCYLVFGDAVVDKVVGARIMGVWDNAQIRGVWGNAQIRDVWDNAQIRGVWGNAQIRDDRRMNRGREMSEYETIALDKLPRPGEASNSSIKMPADRNLTFMVLETLSNLGWVWRGGNNLLNEAGINASVNRWVDLKHEYKYCTRGDNPDGPTLYKIEFVPPKLHSPQAQPTTMTDCMFTIPSWTIPQGCCSRCGGKLTVLFQSTYCSRCD